MNVNENPRHCPSCYQFAVHVFVFPDPESDAVEVFVECQNCGWEL